MVSYFQNYMYVATCIIPPFPPCQDLGFTIHFSKKQCHIGTMGDIYDGKLYQALMHSDDGPLANKRNISVVLNTDGGVVFCSTNFSIWPVLLMINELPYSERLVLK